MIPSRRIDVIDSVIRHKPSIYGYEYMEMRSLQKHYVAGFIHHRLR